MKTHTELKTLVQSKYGQIASSHGCGGCGCGTPDLAGISVADDYSGLEGYVPDADLHLGCGIPVEFAGIEPGQTVLDLGAGAGNDCFVARKLVGDAGTVIGIDFTPEMVNLARKNAKSLGYSNVEFLSGDIESLPLPEAAVDVVISNCVLNLVPDKSKALAEIYRVLKPGGHFCISDITIRGTLPADLLAHAEAYVGCVSGALDERTYLDLIGVSGFEFVEIRSRKSIQVPEKLVESVLGEVDARRLFESGAGIDSLTIVGRKPLANS